MSGGAQGEINTLKITSSVFFAADQLSLDVCIHATILSYFSSSFYKVTTPCIILALIRLLEASAISFVYGFRPVMDGMVWSGLLAGYLCCGGVWGRLHLLDSSLLCFDMCVCTCRF
jgi:hypothetical protein